MNKTKAPIRRLEAGESTTVSGHRPRTLVAVEGDLIVQTAAQWLGDTVIQAPAQRLVAPASIELDQPFSVTAVGTVRITVVEEPTAFDKAVASVSRWINSNVRVQHA